MADRIPAEVFDEPDEAEALAAFVDQRKLLF